MFSDVCYVFFCVLVPRQTDTKYKLITQEHIAHDTHFPVCYNPVLVFDAHNIFDVHLICTSKWHSC